jgi:hypothetical protein
MRSKLLFVQWVIFKKLDKDRSESKVWIVLYTIKFTTKFSEYFPYQAWPVLIEEFRRWNVQTYM